VDKRGEAVPGDRPQRFLKEAKNLH
jgi:hypothetical protein